jgi:hypothetical protein
VKKKGMRITTPKGRALKAKEVGCPAQPATQPPPSQGFGAGVRTCQRVIEMMQAAKTKRKKKVERNEYIAVKQSELNDDGDTFEAIKNGYGIPPMGCKFVKVRK